MAKKQKKKSQPIEKPYPNEHACRIEDPRQFDRIRRKNCDQKSDGKCIDVLYGVKDGKSKIQALRYDKEIWTAAAAKAHCSSRGGSFEAASSKGTAKKVNSRMDITSKFKVNKKAKLDYGEVEVIISNSGTDRDGEQILLEGIDISQIKRNPVVLWGHQYTELPIGQIKKIWKTKKDLMAIIKFDYEIYDFAHTVYKMILSGSINAVSIGGLARQFGTDEGGEIDRDIVSNLEMIELSVVPVGAHPDALVVDKKLNITTKTYNRQFNDFVKNILLDKTDKLSENELRLHIRVLENLTSALKSGYKDFADTEASAKNPEKKLKRKHSEKKRTRRLIVLRQTAKQCDKQSELIISAINNKLKDL